jgi:twitching motility protein PilU
MNVQPLFNLMVEKQASDLFLTCFAPVKIKIDGKIIPVNKLELTPQMVRQAAMELMTGEQLEEFNRELEIDFAISKPGLGRFRMNIFHQRGNVAMVMRCITTTCPTSMIRHAADPEGSGDVSPWPAADGWRHGVRQPRPLPE